MSRIRNYFHRLSLGVGEVSSQGVLRERTLIASNHTTTKAVHKPLIANKPPNGARYPLAGGMRQRYFIGNNLNPRKVLENAQTPTSQVLAVLGWLSNLAHILKVLILHPGNHTISALLFSHIQGLIRAIDQFIQREHLIRID